MESNWLKSWYNGTILPFLVFHEQNSHFYSFYWNCDPFFENTSSAPQLALTRDCFDNCACFSYVLKGFRRKNGAWSRIQSRSLGFEKGLYCWLSACLYTFGVLLLPQEWLRVLRGSYSASGLRWRWLITRRSTIEGLGRTTGCFMSALLSSISPRWDWTAKSVKRYYYVIISLFKAPGPNFIELLKHKQVSKHNKTSRAQFHRAA